MGHTNVGDAVTGLFDLLSGYSALSGVLICDGGIAGQNLPDEVISVCFSQEGPPVQGAQIAAELGARKRQESFTILNTLSVQTGDESVRDARSRAFTLFGFIEDAVRENPQFGGEHTFGDITGYTYEQEINDMGALAQLVFEVSMKPFRRF